MIQGAKSIAEYAIKKWMLERDFVLECFSLTVNGHEGILKDRYGETLVLEYDPGTRSVSEKEQEAYRRELAAEKG